VIGQLANNRRAHVCVYVDGWQLPSEAIDGPFVTGHGAPDALILCATPVAMPIFVSRESHIGDTSILSERLTCSN